MLQPVAGWLQKQPLLFAPLVTAMLFTLTLLVLTPTYESNDDPAISMVASGTGLSVAPDEHLLFSNVGIGLVLKWLYTKMPNFPWYASYLVATQYLAFTVLLYSVLVWRFSWKYLWLFLLVFATLGVNSLVYLQFTRVAFLATECGIVLALTALYRRAEDSQYRPAWLLIVAGGLMVLGSLIRPGSFFGGCVVALPVVVFTAWRLAKESQHRAAIWRPALVTAATVFCLAAGAQVANAEYYAKDAAWRDFFAFNTARANFNDIKRTQYSPETRAVFDAVNWSENDHVLIENWFFDDARVYSLENLTAIVNGRDWPHAATAWKNLPSWFLEIWKDSNLWSMWALLPIFYWQANDRRAFVNVFMLLTCSIMAVLVGLMLFVKYPAARIYFPMYAFQLLLAMLLVRVGPRVQQPATTEHVYSLHHTILGGAERSENKVLIQFTGKRVMAACIACALIGVLITTQRSFRRSREVVKANAEMYATLAEINPHPNTLLVIWGCCLPLEFMLPFDPPAKNRDLQLLLFGCLTQSPIQNSMKERHQIDETATALMTRPNVYLISCDDLNKYFTIYAQEHFQTDLKWEKCYHGKRFSVWKPHPMPFSPESMEVIAEMSLPMRTLRASGKSNNAAEKR